jgi:putative DNA primase/helicase
MQIHCLLRLTRKLRLGLALSFPYDVNSEVVKYRAVEPKDKTSKFAHAAGHPSDKLLYNIKHVEKELKTNLDGYVFVTESERDCLLMESHGFLAVSVSSATTCLDRDGNLKIDPEYLEILATAERIILALDQDPAGQRCAEAFEQNQAFNPALISRMVWPYNGKRLRDPKDLGELYEGNPAGFRGRIDTLTHEALSRPPRWRQQFSTLSEMDDRPIIALIENFLYEGNIGLGGLSGHGKTFVALSISKAQRQREIIGKTNGNLRLVTLDRQTNNSIPSLGSPWGRQLVEEALGDTEVLILDSVSTLFGVGMNDEENLLEIQTWLMGLRSRGLCIILLHHAGKSGLQRGHSRWEDPLDVSIRLSHPQDYEFREGLRVVVTFDKTRGVVIAGGELEVSMQVEDGKAVWTTSDREHVEYVKACEMFDAGQSTRDVAAELGIGKSTSARWRKEWSMSKQSPDKTGLF